MCKDENCGRYDDLGDNRRMIYVRLAYEKNFEKYIKLIPNEKYFDMLMIYYMKIRVSKNSFITMLINYDHLENWGMTEEELKQIAWENTLRDQKVKIEKLYDVIMGIEIETGQHFDKTVSPEEDSFKVYVVSNDLREYGAAALFYPGVMKKAAEILGSDYYVIPSSVHECLIVKKEDNIDPSYLREMLRCINKNDVLPKDVLSNSVYLYDVMQDRLVIDIS